MVQKSGKPPLGCTKKTLVDNGINNQPINWLHPRNLTWNLKRSPWKRRFLLETIIFRFHVKFRGSFPDFLLELRFERSLLGACTPTIAR